MTPARPAPRARFGSRIGWVLQARCRFTNPDDLRDAATICRPCLVATECLADALDNQMEFGVWGGMTERQRRALLRQHPEVNSWSEFFAARRTRRTSDESA